MSLQAARHKCCARTHRWPKVFNNVNRLVNEEGMTVYVTDTCFDSFQALQKRPIVGGKETYYKGKIDLYGRRAISGEGLCHRNMQLFQLFQALSPPLPPRLSLVPPIQP